MDNGWKDRSIGWVDAQLWGGEGAELGASASIIHSMEATACTLEPHVINDYLSDTSPHLHLPPA